MKGLCVFMSLFLSEDLSHCPTLTEAGSGILQVLFCSSPKGSALPLLLLPHCHLEAKPAGEAQLLPPASSSAESWAASARLQPPGPPFSQRNKRSVIMQGFSSLFLSYQPWYVVSGSSLHSHVCPKGTCISECCSF